jgi:serine/threonine protein kinase
MLVSRDGGKNGIANYTALWARKTYSLWESLIAAAQPIRQTAVPLYGTIEEEKDDVAYYTPHFSHTVKALRVMRSLLVEIMDGADNDAMSSFVARALRGEQAIPFLVSICRKDAEIAGRGRTSNITQQESSSATTTTTIKENEDLPDQILNLLSKDRKCGSIVQSIRGVLRRSMYPGYDEDEDAATSVSRTMTRMTSVGINSHAATIPPSSTVNMGGGSGGEFSRPSENDFRFPSDFYRKYILGVLIGDGASCEVHECVSRPSSTSSGGERFAVKRVPKRYFSALASSQRGWQRILDEVEMQQKMSHSAIVEVVEVFEDREYLYVVLELMQDDLLNRLLDRIQENRHYNEKEVRQIFEQLLQALKYLHSDRGITHRDIKPENILLVTATDDTTIKLADFGAACWSRQRGRARMRSDVGSPQYMAPEVIFCALNPKENPHGYTPAVDLWSIGVLLYVMLCRRLPFDADARERAATTDEHEAERRLRNRIMAGTFRSMHDVSPPLSLEATQLIQQLLEVSPTDRLTVDEALASAWMTKKD